MSGDGDDNYDDLFDLTERFSGLGDFFQSESADVATMTFSAWCDLFLKFLRGDRDGDVSQSPTFFVKDEDCAIYAKHPLTGENPVSEGLHALLQRGVQNIEVVGVMLDCCEETYLPFLLARSRRRGRNCYEIAAESCELPVLRYLVELQGSGVAFSPFEPNPRCETLLHHAAMMNGSVEVFKYLYEARPADLCASSSSRSTVAHHLCESVPASLRVLRYFLTLPGSEEMFLCKNFDGCLPLHIAAEQASDLEFLKIVVRAYPGGTKVTSTSDANSRPISHFIHHNRELRPDIFDYLLCMDAEDTRPKLRGIPYYRNASRQFSPLYSLVVTRPAWFFEMSDLRIENVCKCVEGSFRENPELMYLFDDDKKGTSIFSLEGDEEDELSPVQLEARELLTWMHDKFASELGLGFRSKSESTTFFGEQETTWELICLYHNRKKQRSLKFCLSYINSRRLHDREDFMSSLPSGARFVLRVLDALQDLEAKIVQFVGGVNKGDLRYLVVGRNFN